jgi:DNA helicase-2/ATP-dependent DNA helicase PcrA
MNNKVIIAAAGSGKTTLLVKKALNITNQNVLITTYTQANEQEIIKKIIELNSFVPENIVVQTWFAFLLQHGAKPYQAYLFNHDIQGLCFINEASASYISEANIRKHYFDENYRIYSDKISKFVIKCDEARPGKIIDRLFRIYPNIFVDEAQDLSGYDLCFLKLLFLSKINIFIVCDPRQGTYSTNNSTKGKKYKRQNIKEFFNMQNNIEIDEKTLNINYRSVPTICNISNMLYPEYQQTQSGNETYTSHYGVFIIGINDINNYLLEYNPMQLRDSKKKSIDNTYPVINFGNSKGLAFDRVMIYPTKPIMDWLKDRKTVLAPISKAKLYVAITRARYSVVFVCDHKNMDKIKEIDQYKSTK